MKTGKNDYKSRQEKFKLNLSSVEKYQFFRKFANAIFNFL